MEESLLKVADVRLYGRLDLKCQRINKYDEKKDLGYYELHKVFARPFFKLTNLTGRYGCNPLEVEDKKPFGSLRCCSMLYVPLARR